jgi:hypothetical protein
MTGLNKEDNVMSLRLMTKRNLFSLAISRPKLSQTSDSCLCNAHDVHGSKNKAHHRRDSCKGDPVSALIYKCIVNRDIVYHARKQEYHHPLPQQKHHSLEVQGQEQTQ